VSYFLCNRCDTLKDSDEGCERDSKDPAGIALICIDCMTEIDDERDCERDND
jgi:hypothetical protein